MKTQNMKKKFLVTAVVVLLILTVSAGCNKKGTQGADGENKPINGFMGDYGNGAG